MTPSRFVRAASIRIGRLTFLSLLVCLTFPASAQIGDPYQWNWQSSQGWPLRPNLQTSHLPKAQRDAIFRASLNVFLSDKEWSTRISPESEWPKAIWEARIKLMDLDGDGIPEVLLMGGGLESSGDGNSSFRILKKLGNSYKVLYDGTAERVNFDTRRDAKHPIVVLYGHDSAYEGGLELYQIGADGTLHNLANYDVYWSSKAAFEPNPILTHTNRRGLHFDH